MPSGWWFVSQIAGTRYGDRILRSLFAEFVDLERVASASDEDLVRLPGIGESNLKRIRALLNQQIGDDRGNADKS